MNLDKIIVYAVMVACMLLFCWGMAQIGEALGFSAGPDGAVITRYGR